MKLVREHISEKFVEDSDPIEDLRIGKARWFDEVRDFFNNEILGDEEATELFMDIADDKLEEYYQKEIPPAEAADLCYDDIRLYKKWEIKYYKRNPFNIDVGDFNESLNEKFYEESDPIQDLGIGMKHVIEKEMKRTHWKYKDDKTALIWSCAHGKTNYVKWILENGKNLILTAPKIHAHEYRSDPVQVASMNGYPDIVKMLVDHGFKTDYRALHSAVYHAGFSPNKKDYNKIIKILLKKQKFNIKEVEYALKAAKYQKNKGAISLLSEYVEKNKQ